MWAWLYELALLISPPGESDGGLHKLLDHSGQKGPCWFKVEGKVAEEWRQCCKNGGLHDVQSINCPWFILLYSYTKYCNVVCSVGVPAVILQCIFACNKLSAEQVGLILIIPAVLYVSAIFN